MMISRSLIGALLLGAAVTPLHAEPSPGPSTEHGRYLVLVGGCNDCHSPGFAESGGKLPMKDWLTGSPVGFQGPWGTTYPGNLRLSVQALDEGQWLKLARSPLRPPMPSPSVAAMSDDDLRSIYRFIRGLGAAGSAAPVYVPPGQAVATPFIEFVPKNLPDQLARP